MSTPSPPAPERLPRGPEDAGLDDLELKGSIRAVLTWNLTRSAFLDSDGSRERYQTLRGGGVFAQFVRSLQSRIAESSFFELDPNSRSDLEIPYRAGLLSQFVIDYEFLPTYRVRQGLLPIFAFDDETANRLARLEARSPGFREALERAARRQLERSWWEWPVKRLRLSRYGFLQVILEQRVESFVGGSEFLRPLDSLSMGLHALSNRDLDGGPSELDEARDLALSIDISVQWEMVGRILSWLIEAVHSTRTRADPFRFDPDYRVSWRQQPAFAGGWSLPLRTRFFTFHIDEVRRPRHSPQRVGVLDEELRLALARLLQGTALVERGDTVRIYSQRPDSLRRAVQQDEATWEGEACFFSYDTAVIVGLHSPEMIMKLDCDLPYRLYWPIIARAVEYMLELRLLALLVQRESSDLFAKMMERLVASNRLEDVGKRIRLAGAMANLVNRLSTAAAPYTISQSATLISKVAQLRSILGIGVSLEHAERNLLAIQRQVNQEESSQYDQGVLKLTAGLAAFTAVLMGLALPPYYHYSLHAEFPGHFNAFLSQVLLRAFADWWGYLAFFFTVLALVIALVFLARLLKLRQRLAGLGRRARGWRSRAAGFGKRALALARSRPRSQLEVPAVGSRGNGALLELVRSQDGTVPDAATAVRVSQRPGRLVVRFDCRGLPAADGQEKRDVPLWEDETVQVFLAPGLKDPPSYVELEVNPRGTVYDAIIINPTGLRVCLAADQSWTCAGLERRTGKNAGGWWAEIEIPLSSILEALGKAPAPIPSSWIGNFYRIHRPKDRAAEFTAWSPTFASPADFHKPDRFGWIRLASRREARG